MKKTTIRFATVFIVSLIIFSNNMNAQTNTNQFLDAKQRSLATISALTAVGDSEKLPASLSRGLEAGLTVNEIKAELVHLYAYCGFPRSINGLNTFIKVVEERKAKGTKDTEGKTATPVSQTGDKYERGRKTLEKISGQPQPKPAKGYGEFAPEIDRFLKEHLFADIFDNDVLSHQQRELITISALAAMPGTEFQLEGHLSMGMHTGLEERQLNEVFNLIEENISPSRAEAARKVFAKVLAAAGKK